MNIWQITDKGNVRRENQDACEFLISEDPKFEMCVVCDGMGGAKAGNIASTMAVKRFIDDVSSAYTSGMTPEDIRKIGLAAVGSANSEVFERAAVDESCEGMGTTLVAAVSFDGGVVVFNVGDSRAYRINESGITAITKDHSMVQDMVERGDITAEEARTHPNRNLITRALGTEAAVKCDTFVENMENGEYILLCSDGLVNTVTDQEILYEVIHGGDTSTSLERMLEISKSRGAPDNVTAVLMPVGKGE